MAGYENERRAVRALSGAIALPTVSEGPETPFLQLQSLLRETYPLLFSQSECQNIDGGAFLLRLPGARLTQPLLFLGHLDVVPAHTGGQWRFAPFAGQVGEGYVWGRGAADMKGHLIALCEAAESLLADGWQPRADIWFAFSCDEEVRGPSAARMCRLLAAQDVHPALILDEGGMVTSLSPLVNKPVALVGVAEKGAIRFSLSAVKDGAPLERLCRAATRLERLAMRPRISKPLLMTLAALAPELRPAARFMAAHPRAFGAPLLRSIGQSALGRAMTRSSLSLSMAQGGHTTGVVAQNAKWTYTCRVLPGDSAEELLARIRRALRDEGIRMDIAFCDEPSALSPVEGPAWDALQTAIQITFPRACIAPYLVTGGTDACRYESLSPYVYRFSPFALPASEQARVHHANERLSIENLVRGVGFFQQMLQI